MLRHAFEGIDTGWPPRDGAGVKTTAAIYTDTEWQQLENAIKFIETARKDERYLGKCFSAI